MIKRVAIHSVPRSGSSWLGEIFNSAREVKYCYQPLFSYALKDYLHQDMEKDTVDSFFEACLDTNDSFICQFEARKSGKLPFFEKTAEVTHVIYKEVRYHNILSKLIDTDPAVKVILLVRSPLSVVSSWLQAPREFRSEWDMQQEWRHAALKNAGKPEEFNGFKKWIEATRIFFDLKQKAPDRVLIVEYRDLLLHTETIVKSLFNFVELKYEDVTSRFISEASSTEDHDHYSVFRLAQADEKWKEVLHPNVVDEIRDETRKAGFERFL